jgi:benzoyl-CoA reductase subunit C
VEAENRRQGHRLPDAAGMLPVGIMGGGDQLEIIRGDAYFQSYICHLPRSTIEMGLSGKFDCMDGLLFPAICDVIRNLSGMWKIMFTDRYVKYMDFPQNFDAAGRQFYLGELQQFVRDLEQLGGRLISDEALNHSIELYNENRRVINELYQLRSEHPHLVLTTELYLLLRASNVLEVSEHTQLMRDYMKEVVKVERPLRDHVRVVVSGAFCEQPPLSLVRGMESSGCFIVDDDWMLGNRYQLNDTEPRDDPLLAIVDAYLANTVTTASRYEPTAEKGRLLINQVRQRDAEGVLFAAPSFCDPALLDRPMIQSALDREGIPYTAFKYAENTGQIQIIKEQTGTFADSIKLWGTT